MAFDTINKYRRMQDDANITSVKAAAETAKANVKEIDNAVPTNSVFTEENSSGTVSATLETDNSSALTDYMNSYMKSAQKYQKYAMINQGLNTLMNLGAAYGASRSGGSNFFASNGTKNETNSLTPAQTFAQDVLKDVNLTNNLDKAIEKAGDKLNDKTKANLQAEINNANADKANLTKKLSEQPSVINENNALKKQYEEEAAKLTKDKNAQQAKVDDLTDKIKTAANDAITKLDKDDETQQQTITDSKEKVSKAEKQLDTDLKAQDNIIQNAKPDLQAMKTVTSTDAMGNVTTKQVPDTEKRQKAQETIDKAEKEKERLQQEFDKLKENEEKVVQKEAQDKIADNSTERAKQEAIKADPTTDPENGATLKEEKATLSSYFDKISENNAKAEECKQNVTNATLTQQTCQTKLDELSGKILKAEGLLK